MRREKIWKREECMDGRNNKGKLQEGEMKGEVRGAIEKRSGRTREP